MNQQPDDARDDHDDEEFPADAREHGVAGDTAGGSPYAWLKLPLIGLGVFVLALLLMYQRELNEWLSGEPAASTSKPAETDISDARRQDLAIDAQPVTTEQTPATLEIIEEPTGDGYAAGAPDAELPAGTESGWPQPASVESTADNVASTEIAPVATSKPEPARTEPVKTETVKPAPVKTEPAKADAGKATNSRYSADEQALLNASPSYFAVQIIGLRDDDAMSKYIRQHKLDRGLIYHGSRDGKPWQVLVLAPFADRAAAERARDALPEAVRKGGPWIKSLKAIQDEIKAAKR